MVKKIFKTVFTLVLGISLGFLLWLIAFDGIEKLEEKNSLPDEPSGTYNGFFYNNLDKNEKIAYEIIVEKAKLFPEKIRIPLLDDGGIENVYEAVIYDNADLFFLSENCITETRGGDRCYFLPGYSMTGAEYNVACQEMEQIKNFVLTKTENLESDYEKELFIHDYVIDRCEYVDKTGNTYSSAYGCMVKGFASCEGYAKAMKYLLDAAGIENHLVIGDIVEENKKIGHAWNMVRIGDSYYHLDATWNDPLKDAMENKYAYFNVTDKEIEKTHTVEERFKGVCNSEKENYYVKNSVYFSAYDGQARDKFISELARQICLGNTTMSVRFQNDEAMKDAMESLFDMNGIYSIIMSAGVMTDRSLSRDNVLYAVDEVHRILLISDYIADC